MVDAKQIINKKAMLLAAGVVTTSVFATTTLASARGLDKIDLGIGASSQQNNGESSEIGARVLSTDNLENIGVGTTAASKDGDEASQAGLKLETTDNLENISNEVQASNVDGNESNEIKAVTTTQDNLEKVGTSVQAATKDGDEASKFGVNFSFE